MSKEFLKTTLTGGALLALMLCLPLLRVPTANAAIAGRDILIKGPGSGATVYYLASDGKRYVFPNQKTYDTWFSDFSGVSTVSLLDLTAYPLGGNVTYRPGIKMIKITTDPKVYVVDAGGALRWVTSESVAIQLYGADWNTKIDDVPDAFFVNYRLGYPVYGPADFVPATAARNAATINADRNLPVGSTPRLSDTTPMAPAQPVQTCSADVWSCGTWSACSTSGLQSRGCVLVDDCPYANTAMPSQQQACSAQDQSTSYSNGTLAVSPAADDSEATEGSVTGASEAVLAKFRLTAQYESLELTKASFSVATPAGASSLSLFDGQLRVAGPTPVDGAGNAFFSNLGFVIPKYSSKSLTVRGLLNPVGKNGAPSGSSVRVTMRTTAGPYAFEMRGATIGSNTVITTLPGGDLLGNEKILRKTVPTVTLTALPSPILMLGDLVALRFRVAADAGGDVSLKALTVNLQKPNALTLLSTTAASQSAIRRTGSAENLPGTDNFSAGCGAFGGTYCQLRTVFNQEETIAAGSFRDYDVRLRVGGAAVVGDAITASLSGDNALLTGALSAGSAGAQVRVAGTDADFVWSDQSDLSHSAVVPGSSADWASGKYVKALPTDTQVMSR